MVNDDKHTTAAGDVETAHHHNHKKTSSRYSPRSAISATIVVILLVLGLIALILWIVYRPKNPKFTVVGVTVFGVSPPSVAAIQFTIVTRNPNNRVSIYYDHLAAFLSYRNQPITPPLMLPPLHHEKDSTVVMTPIWPVEVNGLQETSTDNEIGGAVSLRLILTGKLRWKAGNIMKTSRKRVYVGCDVLIGLKRGVLGAQKRRFELDYLISINACDIDSYARIGSICIT